MCRKCTGLNYGSQTHTDTDHLFRYIDRVQRRLIGLIDDPSRWSLHDIPDKPKGMWWVTYERLCERLSRLQSRHLDGALAGCLD